MKKAKFGNLNFASIEVLSREELKKVTGGYDHNCPGYTYAACMSSNPAVWCYVGGLLKGGTDCCVVLCPSG